MRPFENGCKSRVGESQSKWQRGVVQRMARGGRNSAGRVRAVVMDDPVLVSWIRVRRRLRDVEAPTLIATSTITEPLRIELNMPRLTSLGALAPRMRTAPMTTSAANTFSSTESITRI